MSKSTRDEVHPLEASLVELIQATRFFDNVEVGAAIRGHLIAALELFPLRHEEIEIPKDERYVVSAMQWGSKARACVESLLSGDPVSASLGL